MGINILNVSVEILHLGKRLSGFIALNKAKAGLFLHKISHLTRTTWCTIVSHKAVMSQIPFQNKSRVAEAGPALMKRRSQFPFHTLGGRLLQSLKCTSPVTTARPASSPLSVFLSFFWLTQQLFKYLSSVLSFSRSSLYTC